MKINENRKGELTTKQIVMIVILIVSFIIVLFLLFRLNLGETSNKEICHNSVVLKEKSGILSGPLDCRTNYLCISGGGDCEEISATSTVKVDPDNKNEIMKALADEMSDCWWMFGEGKIKYEKGFLKKAGYCALCSIISFDEKIQEEIQNITYPEFYDFLQTTKKDESQTYLQYLYGVDNRSKLEGMVNFNINLATGIMDLKERHTVITGVDMNILSEDKYLKTFIIQTSKTSLTGCSEFITKA